MAQKPNPMSAAEQRRIVKADDATDKAMKTYKGDIFANESPSMKRSKAFEKRYGFKGENDIVANDSIYKEESANYRKQAQATSDDEMSKVESGKSVSPAGKANPDSYKRGGKVKRTGMALVHKGERVLTKRQQRSVPRRSPGIKIKAKTGKRAAMKRS